MSQEDVGTPERKETLCARCEETKSCSYQALDKNWVCDGCLTRQEETEDWDEMQIQDAEEGGLI